MEYNFFNYVTVIVSFVALVLDEQNINKSKILLNTGSSLYLIFNLAYSSLEYMASSSTSINGHYSLLCPWNIKSLLILNVSKFNLKGSSKLEFIIFSKFVWSIEYYW